MEYAPECEGCIAMYGSRKPPEDPPCETCRVVVLPDNQEALNVYLTTRNQYIMGFNGPISINQLAVWEVIDRFKVKNPVEVFKRVVRCSQIIISNSHKAKNE